MYNIIELLNGEWQCVCMIQDGHERWIENTKQEAIFSMIQAARVLNGAYILEQDIEHHEEAEYTAQPDLTRKVVLDYDDPRVVMKITRAECEIIRRLREGEITIIPMENK